MPKLGLIARGAACAILGLAGFGGFGQAALAAHDDLTIGLSQFPSSMNPYVDSESVRDYVLGFVSPRITARSTSGSSSAAASLSR